MRTGSNEIKNKLKYYNNNNNLKRKNLFVITLKQLKIFIEECWNIFHR